MGLQVFGTRKSADTRKAERFLKERGAAYQFVDLAVKGISAGELRAIAAALGKDPGGMASLLDKEGGRFKEKGLGHMVFDPEEKLLEDPLLLRMPILRDGKRAAVGFDPEAWTALLRT